MSGSLGVLCCLSGDCLLVHCGHIQAEGGAVVVVLVQDALLLVCHFCYDAVVHQKRVGEFCFEGVGFAV